jgi:uncharacterized membrane protein required for colicin V production
MCSTAETFLVWKQYGMVPEGQHQFNKTKFFFQSKSTNFEKNKARYIYHRLGPDLSNTGNRKFNKNLFSHSFMSYTYHIIHIHMGGIE